MNASIGKNASATVENGDKLIIFDRELSPHTGYGGAMMIIRHELGHHCRHIGTKSDPNQELTADRQKDRRRT